MSYSVDANIMLYASDQPSPHHTAARAFMDSRPLDHDLFYVTWPTLMAYLRVATHPRIFAQPLHPSEAMRNIEDLLSLPRVRVIAEADGFLDVYRQVTDEMIVRGNGVPDAHLATPLRQHGVRTLYTADSDFRRFAFLGARNPLT